MGFLSVQMNSHPAGKWQIKSTAGQKWKSPARLYPFIRSSCLAESWGCSAAAVWYTAQKPHISMCVEYLCAYRYINIHICMKETAADKKATSCCLYGEPRASCCCWTVLKARDDFIRRILPTQQLKQNSYKNTSKN